MKNNSDFPQAPLCLRKQAAAVAIEISINAAAAQNGLSFSDLEEILYRYYVESQRGAERERETAKEAYNRSLEEYKKQKEQEGMEVEDNGRETGDPGCQSDA
jgi:hypothetical protein